VRLRSSGAAAAAVLVLAGLLGAAGAHAEDADARSSGPYLTAEDTEAFLRTAEVIEDEGEIGAGRSAPRRLVLSDGNITMRAAWRTHCEFEPVERFRDGHVEMAFRDSYKHEIAAYELDKVLGLGLVPPTVEREINGTTGALQIWVENAMTEWNRMKQHIRPPDVAAWNEQMQTVRLFHQLIFDTDYSNASNLLVDCDFRIWVIDSTRAFGRCRKLREQQEVRRFSRSLLERLCALQPEAVREALGPYLCERQIDALLERKGLLLERADRLVARHGESAILFF